MSDYEGEGWQPVDLSRGEQSARPHTHSFTDYIAPSGQLLSDVEYAQDKVVKDNKRSLGPRISETFHPVLQNIRPKAHHGTGGRPAERPFELQKNVTELESYKLFKANTTQPNHVYQLDVPWKDLLKTTPEASQSEPYNVAESDLRTISYRTEAFVKIPALDSLRVEIWGEPEQCKEADKHLRAWEGHLRSTGPRPSRKIWSKEHAYDGRKEERKLQEQWKNWQDRTLELLDDSAFGFEAYLVWPQEYDLDFYLRMYDPNVLPTIAKEFRCRFLHEKKARPRYTKVQAMTESSLLEVYQRLINLVKEMIAQKSRGTHGNFFRLPSAASYRDQVRVEKSTSDRGFHAVLTGEEISEEATQEWLSLMKTIDVRNRKAIMTSVDMFVKLLHLSRSHIRLRVDFGQLYLQSFSAPKHGRREYPIDEFMEMLQSRRTQLSDPVFLINKQDSSLILDAISSLDSFSYQKESYKQLFDFQGSDSNNRLRLEIELEPGHDFDEPEICGQRWLTFKSHGGNENVLGLKVFDVEKPSYMFRADAFDLFDNAEILKDLEQFHNKISFRPDRDGLKSYPRLRSSFPPNNRLISVTEVTAAKFRFRNTDGIFEIRREDVFMQQIGQISRLPDPTNWAVSYYYPDWDNLLGEFSNIEPGQSVNWTRDIRVLFPEHSDPDRPRSLPNGFKNFMKEVHEIQTLLKEVLSVTAAPEQTPDMIDEDRASREDHRKN